MAGAQALLGRLNDLQRQAALAPLDRPLLILAAAGTGKTSTLVARMAHMAAQVGSGQRLQTPAPSVL